MLRTLCLHASVLACTAVCALSGQVNAGDDALTVYSAGLEQILVDPRDQSLVELLRLLDERVLELPAEVDEPNMPAPIIKMVLDGLMSPMALRAGMIEGADPAQGPPIYAQLDIHGDAHLPVQQMAGQMDGLLSMVAPAPSQPLSDWPSLNLIEADGQRVYHGVNKYEGGDAFSLAFGELAHEPAGPPALELPRGVRPAIGVEMDFPRIEPLIEMFLGQAPPEEAEMVRGQLQMYGLMGPDALRIRYSAGYARDRMHHAFHLANSMRSLRKSGMAPQKRITTGVLQQVPVDATYAQVSAINMQGYAVTMERMLDQIPAKAFDGDGDASAYDMMLEMFREHTGLDLVDDLLAHFGEYLGGYTSKTTGGGGLLSAVWFAEVTNTEALQQSLDSLCGQANDLAMQHARGYVRFESGTVDGRTVTMLTFPGLPIPLEFCMSIANGYLYAAPSPAGLIAAINQGSGRAKNLTDHPRFKEMGGTELDEAMQVTFMDTPSMISEGYGLVAMGMSALSNAVRSPAGANRNTVLAHSMPSYHALAKDAKASVQIIRVDGDDLVGMAQTDRSFLVNACGAAGMIGGSAVPLIAVAMAGGLTLPAIGQARARAKEAKAASALLTIATGVVLYAIDHGDQGPTNPHQLVEGDYLNEGAFSSPMGPMWDEHGDIWLDTSGRVMASVQHPERQILAYDRAMYTQSEHVAVAFYDGHVEQMWIDEFVALTEAPQHEGIDFKRPW